MNKELSMSNQDDQQSLQRDSKASHNKINTSNDVDRQNTELTYQGDTFDGSVAARDGSYKPED